MVATFLDYDVTIFGIFSTRTWMKKQVFGCFVSSYS